jgi:hypothetical protein
VDIKQSASQILSFSMFLKILELQIQEGNISLTADRVYLHMHSAVINEGDGSPFIAPSCHQPPVVANSSVIPNPIDTADNSTIPVHSQYSKNLKLVVLHFGQFLSGSTEQCDHIACPECQHEKEATFNNPHGTGSGGDMPMSS